MKIEKLFVTLRKSIFRDVSIGNTNHSVTSNFDRFDSNRRRFLSTSGTLLLAVAALSLPAFLNTKSGSPMDDSVEWDLSQIPELTFGQQFDLNQTLPPHVKRGGLFSVSAQGTQLPEGVHLSDVGILVCNSSRPLKIEGIVFCYNENS